MLTMFVNTRRKLYVLTLLILVAVAPFIAQAAIVPDCDPVPGNAKSCTIKDLGRLLINIYNFLLGTIGLVAILFIIFGGLRMLYWTFLENSSGELEAAKTTVTRAITGLIIALCAFVIVNLAITILQKDTAYTITNFLPQW